MKEILMLISPNPRVQEREVSSLLQSAEIWDWEGMTQFDIFLHGPNNQIKFFFSLIL